MFIKLYENNPAEDKQRKILWKGNLPQFLSLCEPEQKNLIEQTEAITLKGNSPDDTTLKDNFIQYIIRIGAVNSFGGDIWRTNFYVHHYSTCCYVTSTYENW